MHNDLPARIADLLGLDDVGADDNLIELGMDSITMMRLAGAWRKEGLDVKFADLVASPTLGAWQSLLGATTGNDVRRVEVDETAPFPLALMQHAYWVGREPGQQLGGVAAHFYHEFDGTGVDPERLERAVRAVIARHGMLRVRILDDGSSRNECVAAGYSAEQCCNRVTGAISEKHRGSAYDACFDTRSQRPEFDSEGSADGCSFIAPNNPFPLCPSVRFGCDNDAGEEDCPDGIDLPCNNHDFCYQTCGTSRAQCDLDFRNDMIEVCNNMTFGQKLLCYDSCIVAAATYYDGVVVGAGSSFVNGQNRACQCCQNVFADEDAVEDVAPELFCDTELASCSTVGVQ